MKPPKDPTPQTTAEIISLVERRRQKTLAALEKAPSGAAAFQIAVSAMMALNNDMLDHLPEGEKTAALMLRAGLCAAVEATERKFGVEAVLAELDPAIEVVINAMLEGAPPSGTNDA